MATGRRPRREASSKTSSSLDEMPWRSWDTQSVEQSDVLNAAYSSVSAGMRGVGSIGSCAKTKIASPHRERRSHFAATANDLFGRHAVRYGFVRRCLVERARRSKTEPEQKDRHDQIGDRHDWRHRDPNRFAVHEAEEGEDGAGECETGSPDE